MVEFARLQGDQVGAAPEGVGGAGHGLHRDATAAPLGRQDIAGEDQHPGVGLVEPEHEPPAVRAFEGDPGETVRVAREVGEGGVKADVPTGAGLPEVEPGAADRGPAGGQVPIVGEEHGGGGEAEPAAVDDRRPHGQVGVGTRPERRGRGPGIGRRDGHTEPRVSQLEGEREVEREGVAVTGGEAVAHHQPGGGGRLRRPPRPADQPVDGVAELGLIDGQLMDRAPPAVAAVPHPPGPGHHHLTHAVGGRLRLVEAEDHRLPPDPVGAQRGADLGDDNLLVVVNEPELLPAGRGGGGRGRRSDSGIVSVSRRHHRLPPSSGRRCLAHERCKRDRSVEAFAAAERGVSARPDGRYRRRSAVPSPPLRRISPMSASPRREPEAGLVR